jgi:sulfonate transport system ATP-binding protein
MRVAALLEEVGLPDIGRLWPKHLSGGMAQRVALARGLFSQPRLLLLDEPFSAVDEITRMRLQDLLQSITRAHRMAVLFVTHDLDEALFLSDRVLLMAAADATRPGRIVREFDVASRQTPQTGHTGQPRQRGDARDAALRAELFASLAALVPA